MAARSESFFRVLGQGLFCGKPVFCPTFDKNAFSQSKQVSRRLGKVSFSKQTLQNSKTSFEKNCFSAWASTLNMGLINKVDMVCLSPVGYGV